MGWSAILGFECQLLCRLVAGGMGSQKHSLSFMTPRGPSKTVMVWESWGYWVTQTHINTLVGLKPPTREAESLPVTFSQ